MRRPREGRCNALSEPGKPNAQAGRPRVDQQILKPGVTTRNEELCELDCAQEPDENQSQQPPPPGIPDAERDAEQKVNDEVFQAVAERCDRPVGRGTQRQNRNDREKKPARAPRSPPRKGKIQSRNIQAE
jgi:hypothetical protein